MAGSGKTQLALNYCRKARDSEQFAGVLWIDGTSKATVETSFVYAAKQIVSKDPEWPDKSETKNMVFNFISGSKFPWIVVLDSYDDVNAYEVEDFLPRQARTFIIITSRNTSTQRLGHSVPVANLSEEEALELFRGASQAQASRSHSTQDERALTKRLGYLALAIAQAGAYINDMKMSINRFLTDYDIQHRRISESLPDIWYYSRNKSQGENQRKDTQIPLSIATTFELSLDSLKDTVPSKAAKIQLLTLSAFLGQAAISEYLFSSYFKNDTKRPDWTNEFIDAQTRNLDPATFERSVAEMGRLCLLQHETGTEGVTWSFHPVVRDWIQHRYPAEKRQNFALLAVVLLQYSLESYGPKWPTLHSHSSIHHLVRPHVESCFENCERLLLEPKALGQTADTTIATLRLANFFASDDKYELAEKLQRRVVGRPPDSTAARAFEVRSASRQLAKTLYLEGRFSEAQSLQESLMKQYNNGTNDFESALVMIDLATTYQDQAHKTNSEESSDWLASPLSLAKQGVDTIEQLQGSNSLDAASAKMLLARVYYMTGDFQMAQSLQEAVLADFTAWLGSSHSKTQEIKQHLGTTLAKNGEPKRAAVLHLEVLVARSRILGLTHEDTLSAVQKLAFALRSDGQVESARKVAQAALAKARGAGASNGRRAKAVALEVWRCLDAERRTSQADGLEKDLGIQLNDENSDIRAKLGDSDSLEGKETTGTVEAPIAPSNQQFETFRAIEPEIHDGTHTANLCTVGILCALADELRAVQMTFDHTFQSERIVHGDELHYAYGRIGHHHVVAACLPEGEYGTNAAAYLATNMKRSFRSIQFCLLVGIGGGVPSAQTDIRLGDVVVGTPVGRSPGIVQYDMGKSLRGGAFEITGSFDRPPRPLTIAISSLRADINLSSSPLATMLEDMAKRNAAYGHPGQHNDQLFSSSCPRCVNMEPCADDTTHIIHRKARPSDHPEIHYGIIASGNRVIKDANERDALAKQHGILCFEMEAAGVVNTIPCLVIRGICDYADYHKNKMWQKYAAATAAAYAKLLLRYIVAVGLGVAGFGKTIHHSDN